MDYQSLYEQKKSSIEECLNLMRYQNLLINFYT